MKNVKKSLALLLSIGLTTSFFLTSCALGGNNSSGSESSSPQEEIEKTGDYLLKDGNSSYKIVLPDDADADEVLAGERLQSLFKEATDTFLPIVKDTEISAINSDDEYILTSAAMTRINNSIRKNPRSMILPPMVKRSR